MCKSYEGNKHNHSGSLHHCCSITFASFSYEGLSEQTVWTFILFDTTWIRLVFLGLFSVPSSPPILGNSKHFAIQFNFQLTSLLKRRHEAKKLLRKLFTFGEKQSKLYLFSQIDDFSLYLQHHVITLVIFSISQYHRYKITLSRLTNFGL